MAYGSLSWISLVVSQAAKNVIYYFGLPDEGMNMSSMLCVGESTHLYPPPVDAYLLPKTSKCPS